MAVAAPAVTGGPQPASGDPAYLLYESRVTRGAEADVVGKHRGALHVVVAADRVDAVQDWDAEARGQRLLLHALDVGVPARGRHVGHLRIAAAQHRPEEVLRDIGNGEPRRVRLDHLADLLFERHAAHEVLHTRVDGDLRVLLDPALASVGDAPGWSPQASACVSRNERHQPK